MTWIAVSDSPSTLNGTATPMGRGTIAFELGQIDSLRPNTMLRCARADQAMGGITIQTLPSGTFVLTVENAGAVTSSIVDFPPFIRSDTLRISYAWDLNCNWGRFAVESPQTRITKLVDLADPFALTKQEADQITRNAGHRFLCEDVFWIAVSDEVEPIGPCPSLLANAPVRTQEGYKFAQEITCDDMILDEFGQAHSILHILKRTVPARGSFQPLKLRAPYFGLQRDLRVGRDQRLVMGGSDVEYMFARERVMVRAADLLHSKSVVTLPSSVSTVTYFQFLLPTHALIDVAGALVESQFIGRIKRNKNLYMDSLLAQVPRTNLPEHVAACARTLRPYEVATLMSQRAA